MAFLSRWTGKAAVTPVLGAGGGVPLPRFLPRLELTPASLATLQTRSSWSSSEATAPSLFFPFGARFSCFRVLSQPPGAKFALLPCFGREPKKKKGGGKGRKDEKERKGREEPAIFALPEALQPPPGVRLRERPLGRQGIPPTQFLNPPTHFSSPREKKNTPPPPLPGARKGSGWWA